MPVLDGSSLDLETLAAVADGGAEVRIAPAALEAMAAARRVAEEALGAGVEVYGLTTGVAERKLASLDAASAAAFSRSMLRGTLVGQGPPAPARVVRAAMACTVNSFAKGVTGVRPELAEMIVDALNRNDLPRVRVIGSVGESDLGPMADLANGLVSATGFSLEANEGLALVNCNSFSTAWACLAALEAESLAAEADVAAALSFEGFAANPSPWHPLVAAVRPHDCLGPTLARLSALLEGSSLLSPGHPRNLQDPISFRSVAQVHAGARSALAHLRRTLQVELNSAQGNPLVVLAERRIVSVANFEAVAVAAALDFARVGLAPAVSSSTERTLKLLQSPQSGLPAGLAAEYGTPEDGLAELAITSQAAAIEARVLAHPVSYEIVSTTKADGIEDRTTMAPLAARRLEEMAALAARVVAIELVVAAQAVDLRRARLGGPMGRAHRLVRELVPFTGSGESLPPDLEPVVEAVVAGRFSQAASQPEL